MTHTYKYNMLSFSCHMSTDDSEVDRHFFFLDKQKV